MGATRATTSATASVVAAAAVGGDRLIAAPRAEGRGPRGEEGLALASLESARRANNRAANTSAPPHAPSIARLRPSKRSASGGGDVGGGGDVDGGGGGDVDGGGGGDVDGAGSTENSSREGRVLILPR